MASMQLRKHAIFATGGFALIAAIVGAVWYLWSSPGAAQYTSGDFVRISNGAPYAFDSKTNLLVGAFQLPNPQTDAIIRNGVTTTIVERNPLTAFPMSVVYFDTNNSAAYNDGEGIISSANLTLEAADTVITTANNALTSIPTTEGNNLVIYLDQGATSSSYDVGEDILVQVYNGDQLFSDGLGTLQTFPNTAAWCDVDDDNVIDFDSFVYPTTEQFINDNDADGRPSAGDTTVGGSKCAADALTVTMSVCFDGSVVNDAEYDTNENIWLDVGGDCASFTSGVDSILVGTSAPTGTSTEFGAGEGEVGFLDVNGDANFNCSRIGTCEPLVYSGTSSDWSTNQSLYAATTFFDSSTEVTDGIATTGTGWDEMGGVEEFKTVNTLMTGGEQRYVFFDAVDNNVYGTDEDIFELKFAGATAAVISAHVPRTFDSDEKLLFTPGQSVYTGGNAALVKSVDAHLTAGALNGTGTDRVLAPGNNVVRSFPSATKFHDHDASGSYADGDDVVSDSDESGYYNADDLLTLAVDVSGANQISDSYLTALRLYQMNGPNCLGSGVDTLIGSDVSSPFLNQPIAITKEPYGASESLSSRTVCIFADVANNSVHGLHWNPIIGVGDADFSSNGSSPSADFAITTAPIEFVADLNATLTGSSTRLSAVTEYMVTYTNNEDAIGTNEGVMAVTFPSGFNVASATAACMDDDVAITGTSGVTGQRVNFVITSGTVSSGSVISCKISNVTNASAAGTTSTFLIRTHAASNSRSYQVDNDNTVSLISGGSSYVEPAVPTYEVTVTSPNGGETFAAGDMQAITWSSSGNMTAVDILYTKDGSAYEVIADNVTNDGSYAWTVPSVDAEEVLVKVVATDLATDLATDTSDEAFAISTTVAESTDSSGGVIEEAPPEEGAPVAEVEPGMFIKVESSATVYYVDDVLSRRPFLEPETYFTYADSFDEVSLVTDETLSLLPIGEVMVPAEGVVLVKFETSPSVYLVDETDEGAQLISVPSEAVARAVFGDEWTSYIAEFSLSLRSRFTVSGEISEATRVDMFRFKKRYLMDGLADTDGDGVGDVAEVDVWGSDPMNMDSDADGYDDLTEIMNGYSPIVSAGG